MGRLCFTTVPRGAVTSLVTQEKAMTQNDLNRAVSRATGETIHTVVELGFGLADPDCVDFDPEARLIDWDLYDLHRSVPIVPQRSPEPVLV